MPGALSRKARNKRSESSLYFHISGEITEAERTVYITENTADFNSVDYSESTVYTGVKNNSLNISTGGDPAYQVRNYGGSVNLTVHKMAVGYHSFGLISFEGLSNVPVGAVITSATIGFFVKNKSGDTQIIGLNKMLKTWVAGTGDDYQAAVGDSCGAYQTYNTAAWETVGAAGNTDRSVTWSGYLTPDVWTDNIWLTLTDGQLLTDVQGMVATPAANYGWRLTRTDGNDDEHYVNFGSVLYTDGYRPYLKVVGTW